MFITVQISLTKWQACVRIFSRLGVLNGNSFHCDVAHAVCVMLHATKLKRGIGNHLPHFPSSVQLSIISNKVYSITSQFGSEFTQNPQVLGTSLGI